jgi:hypothetical protein
LDAGPRCGGQPRLLCLFLSLEERKKTDKTSTRTKLRNCFYIKKSQLDLLCWFLFLFIFIFFKGGGEEKKELYSENSKA